MITYFLLNISGKPCQLYNNLNPDWVPTANLGHDKVFQSPPPSALNSRYARNINRSSKKKQSEAASALLQLQDTDNTSTVSVEQDVETGTCSQTDVGMDLIGSMESEMQRLLEENNKLKNICNETVFSHEYFIDNNAKVKYYTGLPNYNVLMAVFRLLEHHIPITDRSSLSKFQQLILTLIKLRLSLSVQDISYRFKVSIPTVSRVFLNMVDIMNARLKPLICWPERDELRKTMPMSFRTNFGTRVAVIVDCFEIFIDRPSNLMARAQTWSSYKHHNTAKYMIGITPQGVISFISSGYGGRASDKMITENCGFLNKLLPGDLVLADRGFDIRESVGVMCAEVHIPAFTKGKKQLSAKEVESTRKIANVRIHVERVIGSVRQKYTMLQSTVPIDYLIVKDDKDCTLDKIVRICCCLTNLCDSVVSFS